MNKAELIDAISNQTDLTKAEVGRALDAFVETVISTVANGDGVALTGFGVFKPVHKAAREGRNPATGASIQIPESTAPKFQPGTTFKNRVGGAGK